MNSCTSRLLSACAPPLMTFIIGTGSVRAPGPPRYWKSGRPEASAAARATASDTPRIAFAPRLPLFSVPSICFMSRSIMRLLARVHPFDFLGDDVDVVDGVANAFAEVAFLVAVAKLERLARTGRRARRHGRAAERARLQQAVDFDGRIAARIEDLTREKLFDLEHARDYMSAWHRTFIDAERGNEERREADDHDPLRRRRRPRARRGAGEEGEVSGARVGADRRGADEARLHRQDAWPPRRRSRSWCA